MSVSMPEQRKGMVELAEGDIYVRTGFRVTANELLAGGPIELLFSVESLGAIPLRLAVSGDRARQRPGQFSFQATFEGATLADPMALATDIGGPVAVVTVTADSPWQQPIVLNEFVRLERAPSRIATGTSGRLALHCRRPIALAANEAAALSAEKPRIVAVDLAMDLRRDDSALAALVDHLLGEVMYGPAAARERPLALLLSLRSSARAPIEALARHADPLIAARARQALARATQPTDHGY
jgi:hypothetical protein